MTISNALMALNVYPISSEIIEKICIDRVLSINTVYTLEISFSKAFELASADIYMWLHDSPSIVEQEVGINSAIAIKTDLKHRANLIYNKYKDVKFTGKLIGNRGDKWNG